MENKKIPAKLYLCATPIGNLEDITLRCLRVLRGAAAVYCEDTRNTLKLMNHFEIKKTLISCHEHNEERSANEIAERVRGGEAIAFVSDAGMRGSVIRAAVLSGFLLKTISRLRCSRAQMPF